MDTYPVAPTRPDHLGVIPSPIQRAGILGLLGALSAFAPLSMDMYLPSTPVIAASLHAGQSLVQLTLSGCLAGLAAGQLLAGPLSDGWGRKRPLLAGLAAFTVLSAACMVAPSIGILIVLRFLQGMAGATGVVLSLAMARDLYGGPKLASALGTLTLVFGLAPVLAPVIGGQILRFTSWRGVFGVLAAIGVVLAVASVFLPETLPRDRRTPIRLGPLLAASRSLFTDRQYCGNALAVGFGTGALMTYVSSVPFIIEDSYHQSPQVFSLLFTVNALGLTVAAQIGTRLAPRAGAGRITRMALALMVASGAAFCALATMKHPVLPPLPVLFVPLSGFVAAFGMMRPNAQALALEHHKSVAGTASAYMGSLQFAIGAVVAPLAGLAGQGTVIMTGIVIGALCALAALSQTLIATEDRRPVSY